MTSSQDKQSRLAQAKEKETTVIRLQEGWLQIKVPVPFSLKWVNSYLIPEETGYTLIDPGLRTEEATQLWDTVLNQNGLKWTDITRIVLTHQHPDHYGLAGYVQERSGAPVLMSRASHEYAIRLWGAGSTFSAELQQLYADHGMPSERREAIGLNLDSFTAMVTPQPKVSYMEAGDTIQIGGMCWLLIDAPGHADGQLCFYNEERCWMICGDQVLPLITPNVSIVPGESGNPLQAFLNSLEELKRFDVKLAFPGHRNPFSDFAERLAELQQHHVHRLDLMVNMLAEEPRTAYGMCEALFGSRLNGNAHQLRFAMSETLAHLVYLEGQARIVSVNTAGVHLYAAK